MPNGCLGLRAYWACGYVEWQQHWRETKTGELARRFKTITKELEDVIPELLQKSDDAKKKAEIEHQRWEAERRERRRQERERRRAEAYKESRQQLLNIVDAWSLARSIEDFFNDIEQRANQVSDTERADVQARLEAARAMLGGLDALRRFKEWKSPANLPPEGSEESFEVDN